jgi:hypothetical protein
LIPFSARFSAAAVFPFVLFATGYPLCVSIRPGQGMSS